MIERRSLGLGAAAAVSFFIWGMIGVYIGSVMPALVDRFALSATEGGGVFVVWSIGFTAGSLAAERLLRLLPPALLLSALSIGAAISAVGQSLTGNFTLFCLIYGLLGLFGGAVFTASHTLFGALFPQVRASALAVLDLLFSVGNMAGPLVALLLLSEWRDWQDFYLIAGIGLGGIALAFLRFSRKDRAIGGASQATQPAPPDGAPRPSIRSMALALAVGSFGLGALEWTQNVWFVTYALDAGASEAGARLSVAAFTGGMIVARVALIVMPALAGRPDLAYLLFGLCAAGALLILAGFPAMILIGNLGLGAGVGALLPIFLGHVMDRAPHRAATFSMILIVFLTIGGQVASLVIGLLTDLADIGTAYRVLILFVLLLFAGFGPLARRLGDNIAAR